jgi:hypothetical protein
MVNEGQQPIDARYGIVGVEKWEGKRLNIAPNDAVCDATGDASSTKAGDQKILCYLYQRLGNFW